MDDAISAFIRGQGLLCLVLASFYAAGLTVAGLNYGLLIGLATGLLSFIPFVGWALGLMTSVALAIVQFWPDPTPVLMVIGVFAGGQVLDAAVLSPKIVGSRIGLHPVWLIFALVVFSSVFGLVGVLVAVPVAAAVAVLVRFALEVYMARHLQGRREALQRRARRMSEGPSQLVLDLPHRQALDAEDFLVSSCNEGALALVESWPDWPSHAIVITGPGGSGKSHLVNVWRTRSAALVTAGSDLSENTLAAFRATGALAVEDIDAGISDDRLLFHLLNVAREHKLSLLLTAGRAPGELEISLPDLRSRVRALPHAPILPPDEGLIAALLVKLFSDRQLRIEPHVVSHLARHLDRSTEAVQRAVALIDRLALASRRRVTRALVSEALQALNFSDGTEDG
jgi:hypothetical protein